ncbi:MAG: amidase family protein, partial [Pseudomonadota bacterium]
MLDAIAGNPKGDPFTIPAPNQPWAQAIQSSPRPLRIGFFTESPYDSQVDTECVEAVTTTARQLEALGYHVAPAMPDFDGMAMARAYLTLYFGEVSTIMEEARAQTGASDSDFEIETRLLWALGRSMRAVDYVRTRRGWNDFARALGRFFGDYDLYLSPTTGQPPARIGELETPAHLKFAARMLVGLRAGSLALKSGMVEELAQES